MLSVAVDGNDALRLREALHDLYETILQRPAFSPVDGVVEYFTHGKRLRPAEMRLMLCVAAVIHNHDLFKSRISQAVNDTIELFIRVQGREQDRTAFRAIKFFRHIRSLLFSQISSTQITSGVPPDMSTTAR